jgi:HD-GYP domain-containing protein (c-di-GMP phosphodiesterase class II)
MSNTELSQLYWAGVLHDVGKIAISETVLHKTQPLTPGERTMVETHAALGADLILQASEDLTPIAGLVRMHHERWDGRGYPAGLAGSRIALGARILKVVDVFDALTSARPYRRTLAASDAMAYLRSESGTQFDPDVVNTFGDLVTRGIIHAAPVE